MLTGLLHANDPETRTGPRGCAERERESGASARVRLPDDPLSAARGPEALAPGTARADRHVARDRRPRLRGGCAGRLVPLLPPVGGRGRGEDAGGEARGTPARRAAPRPAGGRANRRLRPSQGRRAERVGALGHADARPGRPQHRLDLAPLVPARHAGGDPVPGTDAVLRQDQRRLLLLPDAGLAEHGQGAHRRPDQLPHHGELPRFPSDRRSPGRRLDRRRSALLQQPRRRRTATRRSTSSRATSS